MQAFSHSRVASSMCLSAGKRGVPLFFAKVPYLWKELNFKERRMCADRIRRPCRVLVSMAKKQKAAAGIRKPLEAIALAGLCAAFAGTPVLSRAVSPVPVYAESRDAGGETGKTKAGIAVVNLDEGVLVDGKPVRYSDQIVSLPETGDYTFATLAEAQTGIDTGRFGGYVLIPAGFSRTVVSINSQPDPCEVQYFINKALDKEEVYASLQAVHAFKDRLSDSMSYMYVNNILEEFHTAQDSAETVLENDRTDLASANAVQSEGILSAVTFSEMAVPADTTTPLNAAAYITRNAEILSSIAEDYSAKDSETASRMSAMQQAGAGLSETLAFLAQDSSGVLDGVSGVTLGEAEELLGEADVVVGCLPNTPETAGYFNERRLRAIKPGGLLVNVGRGNFVDCDALARVLAEGHLRGAALDVTCPEPLPKGHPLWSEPRCAITPHQAGGSFGKCPQTEERICSICCENLRHWFAGEPLEHVVY